MNDRARFVSPEYRQRDRSEEQPPAEVSVVACGPAGGDQLLCPGQRRLEVTAQHAHRREGYLGGPHGLHDLRVGGSGLNGGQGQTFGAGQVAFVHCRGNRQGAERGGAVGTASPGRVGQVALQPVVGFPPFPPVR